MSDADALMLCAHLLGTGVMVGVIWFVQLVHYPLFAAVGSEGWVAYETDNTRRTSWVVGPAMLLEGLAAIALVVHRPPGVPAALTWIGVGLLAVIHGSTGLVQVPAHRTLSERWDPATARRLVTSNWVRTVAWSARGGLAVAMLLEALTAPRLV